MERGWWALTKKLVSECKAAGKNPTSPVYKASTIIRKQLNEVTNLLSGPSAVISPAFEWAQSDTHIFINIKFAHKLDTPATLGVKSKKVDIKGNGIIFEAASATKNKRFRLNLKLAREIVPEESEWSMASVGRATVELKKKWPQTAWMKLLKKGAKTPQNMHTWWAMKEQHNSVVSKLDFSVTDEKAKQLSASDSKDSTATATAESSSSSGTPAAPGGSGAKEGDAAQKDLGGKEDSAAATLSGDSTDGAKPDPKATALRELQKEQRQRREGDYGQDWKGVGGSRQLGPA